VPSCFEQRSETAVEGPDTETNIHAVHCARTTAGRGATGHLVLSIPVQSREDAFSPRTTRHPTCSSPELRASAAWRSSGISRALSDYASAE
jgi:hypothetical protein